MSSTGYGFMVDGLLEVDDVDAVALGEDEALHLGVPTTGLVTKVNPSLKQLADGCWTGRRAHVFPLRLNLVHQAVCLLLPWCQIVT